MRGDIAISLTATCRRNRTMVHARRRRRQDTPDTSLRQHQGSHTLLVARIIEEVTDVERFKDKRREPCGVVVHTPRRKHVARLQQPLVLQVVLFRVEQLVAGFEQREKGRRNTRKLRDIGKPLIAQARRHRIDWRWVVTIHSGRGGQHATHIREHKGNLEQRANRKA
jgi:hypothetical protein